MSTKETGGTPFAGIIERKTREKERELAEEVKEFEAGTAAFMESGIFTGDYRGRGEDDQRWARKNAYLEPWELT